MPTTYEKILAEGTPSLELRIETSQPVELLTLVNAFTGIASQFELFIKQRFPHLDGAVSLYVREIRSGSILIELAPIIQPLVSDMNVLVVIDAFITRTREIIESYAGGQRDPELKRSSLKDFNNTVRIIATDPDASAQLSSAEYKKTKTTESAIYKFDTRTARAAQQELEHHRLELELPAHEVHENVLMRFFQSNLKVGEVGKRTGERVIIEAISSKDLAVTYETDLAKDRIKDEMSKGHRNIYKLGFLVDCYVEKSNGKAVLYRVTDVREVFELPDE